MNSDHCADCQRPIRIVRVSGWDKGPKDGSFKIPLDYVKQLDGDYAVAGPETAIFIKEEDRATFKGPLYTDHRRTCPRKNDVDPDRPPLADVSVQCLSCMKLEHVSGPADFVKKLAESFLGEHIDCRGRKAS
jgi:hypothetical protein